MFQHFHILTLTHRHTDLKNIGRLATAFTADGSVQQSIQTLMDRQQIDECFYLATCNRISWFFTTKQQVDDDFKVAMLEDDSSIQLRKDLIHYQGNAALTHLFEVAASVDSLVVGERQILGQLRDAYETCKEWGFTGDDMRIIFDKIVVAAKDVYAKTRIGEKSVSVVSLSIQKLLQLAPVKSSRVLLIGAGQTNQLVAKFLRKYEYDNVVVFNRSLPKAEQLAKGFLGNRALKLDELNTYAEGFDVIIVCTAAHDPIVNKDNFSGLLNGEQLAGKLLIDLAIPNNVSDDIIKHRAEGMHYVGVEDLKQLADENMSFRSRETLAAKELLAQHLLELEDNYRQRKLERVMGFVPNEMKKVRSRALNEVFAKELEAQTPEVIALVEKVALYMEKKCISIPMKAAREGIIKG